MTRAIHFTLACALALLAGCFSPRYTSGNLACADREPACPFGFYCAADRRCWKTGEAPGARGGTPAAVFISSGGGSASGPSLQLGCAIGGTDTVGTVSSSSSATFTPSPFAAGAVP